MARVTLVLTVNTTLTLHTLRRTPVVNFINILHTNFLYERRFSSFFYVHVTREKLPKRHSYKKFARKMLMKLTPGRSV